LEGHLLEIEDLGGENNKNYKIRKESDRKEFSRKTRNLPFDNRI
jgi:hypothetical protein